MADRHCAPVIEAVWRARTFLSVEDQSCADRLQASEADLQEAVAQARICGYMTLHEQLDELFFGDQPSTTDECEAKVAGILEFGPALKSIVDAYH